jgi:CRP-like cAMP-binding protein
MPMTTLDTLKRCEVFLSLNDSDMEKIICLPSCHCRNCEPEETVFTAGENAEYIYVLEEGQIDLLIKVPKTSPFLSGQTVLRSIVKGGVFGWPAVVPPHVYTLTAVVKRPSKLMAIGGEDLRRLFKKYPEIGYEVINNLLHVIGGRFRNIEQLLISGKKSPLIEIQKR